MTRLQLIKSVESLQEEIDETIDSVSKAALEAQKQILQSILNAIERFQINDGRFVSDQSYARKLGELERQIEDILGNVYIPKVSEYLNIYSTIQERNESFQLDYNGIRVRKSLITPAREAIYESAKYELTEALRDKYIMPAKYLLMQHITSGISIADSRKLLDRWNDGKTIGDVNEVPNLEKYATQISRDAAYKHNGAINGVIAEQYGLKKFIYVGSIIEDSRPLCRHLVNEDREIALSEMPELIKKYPQGLYPNTTSKNFISVCGGYGCRHTATPC